MQRLSASFIFLLVLISVSIVSIPVVHAQELGIGDTAPLSVSIDPEYPAPYQTINVEPSSSAFDLSASTVNVSVNGVSIYKGSGGRPIPVTVGGPGSATTINISVTNAGQVYTQKIVVHPASVALVVEPISTSHAFYAGRSLVPSEGTVRFVAIPDIRTSASSAISPDSLVYTWKFGDQILEDASGIGKDVLSATAPQEYRNADVSVTVSNQSGTITAQASTAISPTTQYVRIYQNDPLMGPLFDTALSGSISMNDTEETYRAIPYFFAQNPTYSWTVNGAQSGSDPDITVRSTGSGQGTAVLGFSAQQSNPLASAAATISVLFGQKASGGIFGL